jgi:hypothetical protein
MGFFEEAEGDSLSQQAKSDEEVMVGSDVALVLFIPVFLTLS